MKKQSRLALSAGIGLGLGFATFSAWALEIEAPAGGWRFHQENDSGFAQQVQYPASSVNSSGNAARHLIKGRIAQWKKQGKPATLVVNGVAMPLLVGDDGAFSRPYAFGRGSNSIEVRDGGKRSRVQFYDGRENKLQARLRVVMSWDTGDNDLDLHVVSPDGQHVFWAGRTAANGGALDVDVTTGFGPEIYANPTPPRGLYHVFVYYWGAGKDKGELTSASISLVTHENTVNEKQQNFRVPLRKPGDLVLVKSFYF
ncbi:DUF2135 domain-containing protein [Massilia sp. W12]|uniref:YfaP family protein n=1 Tax=Massilia sp. W12 TaxID=3126507 RepID=UPI0030D22A9F